jgi:hypothetical protein
MKRVMIVLFLHLLYSCHPGYRVYVANLSHSNIYLKTEVAIDSLISIKEGVFYDSIISKRINVSNDIGLYKIRSGDKIYLYGGVGSPSEKKIPFKSIQIIKESDTIEIDRNNLMDRINKKINNFYYIEVN